MQRIRRAATLVTTAAIATAMLGGTALAGGTLTKKEYLKEANATCASANEEIDAIFEQAFAGLDEDDQPTDDQIAAAIGEAVPVFRQAAEDVDALEGPAAFDKKVGKVLDELKDVLDEVEADPATAFGEGSKDPFAKVDKKARKLGLKECAS